MIRPWTAPTPNVATSKDVRALRACVYCERLKSGALVAVDGGSAHVYCLVVKAGPGVLATMSSADLGTATLDEIVALDMKDTFMGLYQAAKRREERQVDKPMMVGPMMSDVVSWFWSRSGRWWMARLADGSELYAIHHSRGKQSHWSARVRTERSIDLAPRFETPREAQLAAVNEYLRQEGKPPID